jgi:hypothetical protein
VLSSLQFNCIWYLAKRLSCITISTDLSSKYLDSFIDVLTEGFRALPLIKEANGEIWESCVCNREYYCLVEFGAVWKQQFSPKFGTSSLK